jgi:putative endonuclease
MLNLCRLVCLKWVQFRKNRLKKKSYHRGLLAESWVAWVLKLKGYHILARRFRTPAGEIDLVAAKRGLFLLIEVKSRPSLEEGLEALRFRQRRRLLRAAAFASAAFPKWSTGTVRFDLAIKTPWSFPYFLKNVDLSF